MVSTTSITKSKAPKTSKIKATGATSSSSEARPSTPPKGSPWEFSKKLRNLITLKTNIKPRAVKRFGEANKGKYGLWLENYLGIKNNRFFGPDGLWAELKIVSLARDVNGFLHVKDTVAICQAQKPVDLDTFMHKNSSSLFVLLDKTEEDAGIVSVIGSRNVLFWQEQEFLATIEQDLNAIAKATVPSSSIGTIIQSRTKGYKPSKKGNKTRALYYKKDLLAI